MSSTNERTLGLLRLLMAVFGVFFGGWWTDFLVDIFNSTSIVMLNKTMYALYVPFFFVSFYVAIIVTSLAMQAVFFALADAFFVIGITFLFSPAPVVSGEGFEMKTVMALISLFLLQILILHYLKLTLGSAR